MTTQRHGCTSAKPLQAAGQSQVKNEMRSCKTSYRPAPVPFVLSAGCERASSPSTRARRGRVRILLYHYDQEMRITKTAPLSPGASPRDSHRARSTACADADTMGRCDQADGATVMHENQVRAGAGSQVAGTAAPRWWRVVASLLRWGILLAIVAWASHYAYTRLTTRPPLSLDDFPDTVKDRSAYGAGMPFAGSPPTGAAPNAAFRLGNRGSKRCSHPHGPGHVAGSPR